MLIPIVGLRWTLAVVVAVTGVPGAIGLTLASLATNEFTPVV